MDRSFTKKNNICIQALRENEARIKAKLMGALERIQ